MHNLLLAPHADGSSDLLYAHADMWLSRRMYTVLRGPRRQQIHMPGSYKRPNYPTNEPVTESSAMTSCHTPGEADFYSERWIGWNNSNRAGCNNGAVWKAFCWANTCSAMLQSGRTDELDLLLQSANTCCYSWSDLLYLPSHTQRLFSRMVTQIPELRDHPYHEAVVGTVVEAIERATGRHTVGLRCGGSCCAGSTSAYEEIEENGSLCHHPVDLRNESGWRSVANL